MKNVTQIRTVLKFGSTIFGLSAIFLIVFPNLFLELLNLSSSDALIWAMRMIGITLVALTGNMYVVSSTASDQGVTRSGFIMMISATSLGILTLIIPSDLSWFTITYAAIGFVFGAIYATLLLRNYRSH